MEVRTTDENINILEFYNGHPYTTEGASLFKQCVWYVLARVGEILGYPMTYWESMPNCSPNPAWTYVGVRDAKHWLKDTRWQVSSTPVVKSVIVLDGNYGHVAVVEECLGNGMYGISQFNKNSDRKFHYEIVNLNSKTLYGMKILGYLVIPVKKVERDENKHQIKVVVDQLRIRKDHSTNSQVIRYASNGELFNVLEEYQDDYKWVLTDVGWLATTDKWVEEYLPINQDVISVNDENRELKFINANLKDMLNATQDELSKTKEELEKALKTIDDIETILRSR